MSTLRPRQKVRINSRAGGAFEGEIGYITEHAGGAMWRVRLASKPNLPPLTFGADELEAVE